MSTVEIKYLCTPHDGKPGESWEKFEGELLDVAAGKTDDRGWSLADAFTQVDEGSAGGPALPGGAAGQKAGALRRRRLKDSYSLLVVHELDEDYKIHLKQNFFQDGPGAFAYMQGECQQPADRLKLRSLNKDWDALDMLTDVGVSPNSVSESAKKIKAVNSKRPVASRKDQTECAERLLEMIFQCSKHFSTLALTEYNAPPANWQFTIAGGPAAGQRDFTALTAHFHALWKAAVDSKLPGFHARPPAAKPATPMRTTLEAGLHWPTTVPAAMLSGHTKPPTETSVLRLDLPITSCRAVSRLRALSRCWPLQAMISPHATAQSRRQTLVCSPRKSARHAWQKAKPYTCSTQTTLAASKSAATTAAVSRTSRAFALLSSETGRWVTLLLRCNPNWRKSGRIRRGDRLGAGSVLHFIRSPAVSSPLADRMGSVSALRNLRAVACLRQKRRETTTTAIILLPHAPVARPAARQPRGPRCSRVRSRSRLASHPSMKGSQP